MLWGSLAAPTPSHFLIGQHQTFALDEVGDFALNLAGQTVENVSMHHLVGRVIGAAIIYPGVVAVDIVGNRVCISSFFGAEAKVLTSNACPLHLQSPKQTLVANAVQQGTKSPLVNVQAYLVDAEQARDRRALQPTQGSLVSDDPLTRRSAPPR